HIISVLVENEAGALSRISGLFSARGYNIETLTVAPTEDASMSRMTIVTTGSEDVVEQITKQLNKLIDVVKVVDLSEAEHIERELMLIKVRAGQKEREDMKRMATSSAAASSTSRTTPTPSSSPATAASSTLLYRRSTRAPSSKPCAPAPAASAAATASCASSSFRGIPMKVYYDKDADLSLVKGKKVTIIGYGSQGHAHAQNLQESGIKVTVALRKGGASWDKAKKAGVKVAEMDEAIKGADIVMILLSDEHHAQVYREY